MANNRELSQLASFVTVNDTSKAISFGSTIADLNVAGVVTATTFEGSFSGSITAGGNIIGTGATISGAASIGGTATFANRTTINAPDGNIFVGDYNNEESSALYAGNLSVVQPTSSTVAIGIFTAINTASPITRLRGDGSVTFGSTVTTPLVSVSSTTGGVGYGTTGSYPGRSVDNKTLDDYEEGTTSMTLTGFSAGDVAGTGDYTKIGDLVFIRCLFDVSGASRPTSNFTITGLPFEATKVTNGLFANGLYTSGGEDLSTTAYTASGSTTVGVGSFSSNFGGGGNFYNLTLHYQTAA